MVVRQRIGAFHPGDITPAQQLEYDAARRAGLAKRAAQKRADDKRHQAKLIYRSDSNRPKPKITLAKISLPEIGDG